MAENKMLDGLSFDLFVRILSSSDLNITSELEVAKAVNSWIEHDPESRSKLTIDLVKTIRLPLLSTAALNTLLNAETFSKCAESKRVILKAISDKTVQNLDPSSVDCRVRHCAQDNFEVALCGNKSVEYNVFRFEKKNFSFVTEIACRNEKIEVASVEFVNEVFYFLDNASVRSHSILTGSWDQLKLPDGELRTFFNLQLDGKDLHFGQ